ncbi:MAG TPA: DUF559 domain-containing protein [Solirubrobacterales bacterium]|nr:DUF559 domain-containing protein [Solirubrobacterales bacterium]
MLARIAARQHGVVSRPQILALGVDLDFVHRLLAAGRLHALHLGVYAVGHSALTDRGRWMAAVLAAGEGALLSHLSAALLWGIVDRVSGLIHVLAADGGSRTRPGLIIHRTRHLPPEHCTERDGIPVTTVARTLLDLAAMLPPRRLRFVVEAADRNGLLDMPALVALCDSSPGRKGTGVLRRLALEQRGAVERTKSPPETAFLSLCLAHGLPEPLVNSVLHGYEVDFYWPQARLVVEIDTYTYHRSWAQRQRDLERDADLQVRGEQVLRFTRERVERAGGAVAGQVASLLAVEPTPTI